ncbi:carbohydrate ABC transporter permease [Phycisphaera mikurensis]|uniref:Putative ABC transporter permease protein n=1 Tax=Phycisphaera mikurensis (strain NBRC 102666 / KCTC 22515 / FYK2301M01) TaxID=1142394 RepID=I0ICQ6_PHYMF|nr:carbohydrate ABC transporter permease [Phycisphaera mikurensis]MBB6442081.1 multiple sugar transport system permease protein [Phycisphaera mikurensis]BAM03044.1 putative ABC transporter permease protein [Phycisphaera mikurensis NBRC 102666]
MPLISPIEARTFKGRALHAGIVAVLLLITASTVYPFLVMLSGSVRSEFDAVDLDLVPSYLVDQDTLHRKFLATKYDLDPQLANTALLRQGFSFTKFPLPEGSASPEAAEALAAFLTAPDFPRHWATLGNAYSVRDAPENLRRLQEKLFARYDGDLARLSAESGTLIEDWALVRLPQPRWLNPGYLLPDGPLEETYFELLQQRPAAERVPVSVTGFFLQTVIFPKFGQNDTAAYNAAHAEPLAGYHDFRLPERVPGPDQPELRAEWLSFARGLLNPSFVVVDGLDDAAWAAHLREQGAAEAVVAASSAPAGRWLAGREREAYEAYLRGVDPERLRLVGPEFAWAAEHPDLPRMQVALAGLEQRFVAENAGSIRWDFLTRNYVNVWNELTVQGRVLFNTAVFCLAAILLALLVNPLAAYALSRYRLPSTYKILLFLIATMAFPPMVTMIPQFVMLRNLGLLNTFLALVLPLIVNGYMIFLLKGFFDALPQELYEAATIDGAGELRMFFQITMALSKPILAILALGTFTGAYTMFLYPLLVAPDQDMWLMSVWLFQFQQRSTSAAVFASVVIASVPTLIVFLFTQRMIMRGIAVPQEK